MSALSILLAASLGYILGAASLATLALAAHLRTPRRPSQPSIGRD